ncbi:MULTISPECIES: extracellular solute-binding protein [Streptomyces]|uniref:Maltose/maltodextrin-binding protein n=2 Tax=Streptomyces TaxID=1883 RepID=A0A1D8G6D8_9ACTN|nr:MULTISPECIES: extracellular solute-binding protein [Streptomyces]AOT60973.1 Maltose/maltodextrin-binding protein precursor [Streptomyces rubrolavendulae]KAF0651391.1 sugar ABC transporter substrate-binding protein [Streptomyces fradiae ATCC 10745 = DSM 40063]OSY49522.1 Maltose/maltodextrin-binding protein precursor [Streptomyces fradiae ATCC 10745 = DSM 40063]QEV14033.1 extracellular solute-binding protein [Streptomyces fradiae ATCC 10745 = DSM 40063]UQS30734.1 extracellular solute-binding 
MKRKLIAAIGVAGMMVGVVACGGSDKGGDGGKAGGAKELTVWLTVDAQNNWPELVKAADDAIAKKYPGIKIKHEYYGWPDKNTKLDAVLATDKAPDVVEMGNTEMIGYMAKGAFAEVDPKKFANSDQWLDALKASVTYNGKTYGVPYYAGGRVGTWRKDIAAEVGVKTAPKTWAELTSALDKIQAKKGDKFSAWYQPSPDWYGAMAFVYGAGGSIAEQNGETWKANLSSPESVKGLNEYKSILDKYMHGDKTKDESDRPVVFGQGNAATMFAAGWEGATAADPKNDKVGGLKDKLENFVMPGPSGQALPVFLGGSDLAVPVKSKNQEVAAEWIAAFTGPEGQKGLAAKGNLPNNKTDLAPLKNDPATAVPATAAESSWFVPTAPGWGQVEKGQILKTMLIEIANGKKSVEAAAKDADAAIDKVINTK